MRTVTSAVEQAIARKERKMFVRARIYNMRTYFSALSSDYPYDSGVLENYDTLPPYPSDIYYYSVADKVFTVLVDMATIYTGAVTSVVRAIKEGSSSAYTLTFTSSNSPLYTNSRPAVSPGGYIFHIATDGQVYRNSVNWSIINGGTGQYSLTGFVQIGTLPDSVKNGSIISISDTVAIAIYPHYGGFGVTRFYYDTSWHQNDWDNAFMFPTKLITEGDYKNTWFSGAASPGSTYTSDAFIYVTDPETGAIQAVKWDATHSVFTQTWISLQSDLSAFKITNALYTNGRFMLAGQFIRNDEYLSHPPVAMILTSTDGKHMAINQYSLLSKLGWRFGVKISGSNLYGSDLNRVIRGTIGAYLGGTSYTTIVSDLTTHDIVTFSSEANTGSANATLDVRAAGHEYEDDEKVIKYSRCCIALGYMVDNTTIGWTDYENYIIISASPAYADGKRTFVLEMVQEAFWLLQTQTPPFYTEIIGKSGAYDDLENDSSLTKLYPAPSACTLAEDHFTLDFWNAEEWEGLNPVDSILSAGSSAATILDRGGVNELIISVTQVANHWKCWMSADIKDKLGSIDYPEVKSPAIKVRLYGWNELMPATQTWKGTQLKPYVFIDRNGTEMGLECTLSSTYDHWTRTYYSGFTPTGNMPIEYTIGTGDPSAETALQPGDKIMRLGIMAGRDYTISNVTLTTMCIERAEFVEGDGGELVVGYEENAGAGWEVLDEEGVSNDGLKLPAYGRYIMFSTKPSFSFDGSISAEFSISEGDNPSTVGLTAFGLVLLAEDAMNCIIGRLSWRDKRWQIIKVRDGEETELAYWVDTSLPTSGLVTIKMRFVHYGAKFMIYMKESPVCAYTWDPAQGPIATGSADIMHTGIYGEKTTASFRCTSYDARYADGIGLLPGEDLTGFATNFPDPGDGEYGMVMIDGVVYKYGSRPAIDPDLTRIIGPYQTRGVYSSGGFNDAAGVSFPGGTYLHMRYFRWNNSRSIYQGILLCIDNGYNWKIYHPTSSNVECWNQYSDEWTIQRRSLHTSPGLVPYISNFSNRTYITTGLYEIVPTTTIVHSHSHGTRVYLYGSEEIVCKWFSSFTASNDFTIKDMIKMVSDTSGAKSSFSGDFTPDDIQLVAFTEVQLYPPTEE